MRLSNRIAIVTGAAQGIGRATAELFATEGAAVVCADIESEGGAATAARIRAAGGSASFVQCDVSDDSQVFSLVQQAVGTFGGLDIVANIAGILISVPIAAHSSQDWDRVMAVNVRSCMLLAKHGSPHMAGRSGAAIVNVASAAAFKGVAGGTAYSASKGAVIALTRALAVELAPQGIRVNCVAPGLVDTPFNDPATESMGGREALDRLVEAIVAMKRQSSPPEMARNILYLASEDSSYVTGQTVIADGGLTL